VAAAGFRVIAFDNRGFGLSDKPPAPYDNAAYARLAIALMDSLRLTDAVLVGHSMGGAIAAQVAIEHPARVRGLVLVGSAGLGAREPLLFRVARWPVLGPAALALRGRGFTARLLRSTYFDPGKVTEADVDQYYAPVAQPEYGRALRGVLQHFRFTALEGRLDRIAAPTLVLWGEEDRWVPMGLGRALAAGITRSAFVSVPHAGHSVQEEAPDEVNHLVTRFLKDGLPRIPADLALAR
jgi:pimeloyl-ACP methyl ester carboxylesterase